MKSKKYFLIMAFFSVLLLGPVAVRAGADSSQYRLSFPVNNMTGDSGNVLHLLYTGNDGVLNLNPERDNLLSVNTFNKSYRRGYYSRNKGFDQKDKHTYRRGYREGYRDGFGDSKSHFRFDRFKRQGPLFKQGYCPYGTVFTYGSGTRCRHGF